MELLGLPYEIDGYGYIKEQSIMVGTEITDEMTLQVVFNNKYSLD